MDINIVTRLMKRQRMVGWHSPGLLSYCEDISMERVAVDGGRNFITKNVFDGSGPTLAIAFSTDGKYMASGHSRQHHVCVHCLVPRIRLLCNLTGHVRSPWCLTFDPSRSSILYSGCLEGVVNKWHIESGSLIGSFNCQLSTPITSIVPLPPDSAHILVAVRHGLYLLSADEMAPVWKSAPHGGVLRQIKYLVHRGKLLTVYESLKRVLSRTRYRLQLVDFRLDMPPDLNNVSSELIEEACKIRSPQSVALTSKFVIFLKDHNIVCCPHSVDSSGPVNTTQTRTTFFMSPEVLFMDVSPSERYLLLGTAEKISIFSLESCLCVLTKCQFDNMQTPVPVRNNCGVWMPTSSAYGLGVCLGNSSGKILMYTNDKCVTSS